MRRALAIAGKDLREATADGRLWLAWALAVGVLAVAALQGWTALSQDESERSAISSLVRTQWETQGEKNPHSGAHFGQYVFKPASASAFIDAGVNADAGRAIWLDPHRRNLSRLKASEDQSAAERLSRGGVGLVLQWILPLLVVLLSFGAVAGEREAGTWRMLASLGVTSGRLLAGKLAGLGLVLAPTWAFFSVVLGLVAWLGGPGSADTLGRIAGLTLLYTLYLAIFGLLALGVSARCASASRALALLLVLWGINGFVAPRLGAAVASAAVGLPTSEQFHAAVHHDIQRGMGQDGDASTRYQRFLAATLARYGVSRAEELPVGLRGLRLIENDAYSSRVHDKHFRDLESRLSAQAEWQLWGALLAPLMPVRALSQALAGTDLHHHMHFAAAAETYRRGFVDATSERIAQRNTGTGNAATADNEFWASLAPFAYRPPTWTWGLAQQWRALALLALWLLAAAWFAVSGFRRFTTEV
ncbi:DUF3526 domain-containing protein [Roseateles cavernae]|uniref:DUF3526 domain-containing protein n=1 Tax=Roseateles cavernae TaxID=3153578 RepID=UPI0032E37210